jgi:hypothetical protein
MTCAAHEETFLIFPNTKYLPLATVLESVTISPNTTYQAAVGANRADIIQNSW